MSKLQIIGALMKKEIALELKTRYAISSLGLFVLAVAFLVYYTTEGCGEPIGMVVLLLDYSGICFNTGCGKELFG